MYSVVLLAAMTGGAEAPAGWFGHGGCHGDCYGYCTGYYAGCSGWSCGGYSCHGGWGHHHGCCGGYSCHGGWGHSCHGGYSCHGCCGGYAYDCGGCCGGGWFGHHRHHHGWGCCGGYSCHGCYGYVEYGCCGGSCMGGAVAPAAPATLPPPAEKKMEKKETMADAPATLIVTVPADAKLLIDDAATVSTSARRVFVSPALPAGREFTYTLKATYTKDGKPVVVSKEVAVRAGSEVEVTLEAGLAGVASR